MEKELSICQKIKFFRCLVFSLRHFSKGDFPSDNFPMATSQMCKFPSGNFPKGRLEHTWEVAAWEIALLGSCHLGEKFPLGKNFSVKLNI